ncbi:AraC family transcriptional regulator [Saccharibacillus sp. CPCC 101409]|uniref:helix-turn-helix transcriptional regulator n=1 Tax=Saccharibacillus sp. CPCC 101409 TaxID=3058041 RepID=UPI0026716AA6|nr:AraC family transcriptional regulator [Saccharibacillus sp. CPCC 101409]MDO3410972.1 AraC family transcriptional regulator [Saccharibacillus sp. CPCC 101409]
MSRTYEVLADYFAAMPLQLFGAYRTRMDGGRHYDGHRRRPTEHCAVIVALEGEAVFAFDETERYSLSPGRVLIGGAGRRLEVSTGTEGFRYFLCHYSPIGGEDLPQYREPRRVSVLDISLDPGLLELIERLLDASSAPNAMDRLNRRTLFYRLIADILQSERHLRNPDSYRMAEDAIAYIQAHFNRPLTLAQLAGRYDMKPKYFSYLFAKYTGTGPIDYLIRYRMNKAHEWLLTKQFSVAAVAAGVGYSDPYYFSRLFKKYKGVAPSQVDFDRPPIFPADGPPASFPD